MAPEVWRCESEPSSYTSAIDIWAIGCILFESLTGHIVFGNSQVLARYQNGDKSMLEPLDRSKIQTQDGVVFIRSLLSVNANERPTAKEAMLLHWMARPTSPTTLTSPSAAAEIETLKTKIRDLEAIRVDSDQTMRSVASARAAEREEAHQRMRELKRLQKESEEARSVADDQRFRQAISERDQLQENLQEAENLSKRRQETSLEEKRIIRQARKERDEAKNVSKAQTASLRKVELERDQALRQYEQAKTQTANIRKVELERDQALRQCAQDHLSLLVTKSLAASSLRQAQAERDEARWSLGQATNAADQVISQARSALSQKDRENSELQARLSAAMGDEKAWNEYGIASQQDISNLQAKVSDLNGQIQRSNDSNVLNQQSQQQQAMRQMTVQNAEIAEKDTMINSLRRSQEQAITENQALLAKVQKLENQSMLESRGMASVWGLDDSNLKGGSSKVLFPMVYMPQNTGGNDYDENGIENFFDDYLYHGT